MKKLTLYYSVDNGGDGSAYPRFYENHELCSWDQEHMLEGWGESCDGQITIESESDMSTPNLEITGIDTYYIERYYDWKKDNIQEREGFVEKFYPNGLPVFTVTTEETKNDKYLYNNVFVDGKIVAKIFRIKGSSGKFFEELLNK